MTISELIASVSRIPSPCNYLQAIDAIQDAQELELVISIEGRLLPVTHARIDSTTKVVYLRVD